MKTVMRRVILATAGVAAVPLLCIVLARVLLQVQMPDMTRDVAAIANIHPLSGALSSLGILVWWTSATICLFTAFVQRGHAEAVDAGELVYTGLLSVYLGLDDLFQFHERLAPTYLNLSEKGVYGLLAVAVAIYLWRYRRIFREPSGVLLLLALGLLSGSVVVDVVLEPWLWRLKDWSYFVEDGLKWLGICSWAAFCGVRASAALRRR